MNAIRCWACGLNQFETEKCRRCHKPLVKPVDPEDALVAEQVEQEKREWKDMGYHEQNTAEIASRIKQFRMAKGWSQQEFANRLNIVRSYITKIESGRIQPTIKNLVRIAETFGISIVDFLVAPEELAQRKLLADPFILELFEAGQKLNVFEWSKIAAAAQQLSRQTKKAQNNS